MISVGLAADSRGGSRWVHEQLAEGDLLKIGGARNNFTLDDAPGYQFVAGGIGVTPMLSMARFAHDSGLPWRFDYGGRSRDTMAYVAELTELADSGPADRLAVVPQDVDGLLDLHGIVDRLPEGHLVYACGPAPMLLALREICVTAGVADRLHIETFEPLTQSPPTEEEQAFEVVCDSDGRTINVLPGTSILEALEGAGLSPSYGCREGTCSSCEVGVLAGIPDHRDSVLTDVERAGNDCIMICTSRSLSARLILDI